MFDTWRAALKKDLKGKSILFKVSWMRTDGTWIFVNAEAVDANLKPMNWMGTAFEEQAKMGLMDQMSQCLLQNVKGKWTVRAMVMGATDVAWLDWPTIHKAPKAIFPLPEQLKDGQ